MSRHVTPRHFTSLHVASWLGRLQRLERLEQLEQLQLLEWLERLLRMEQLEQLERRRVMSRHVTSRDVT